MADNFNIDPSGATVVAADDISSVIYPRSKLVHGADGVNDGDVSRANPFPVSTPPVISAIDSNSTITRPANTTPYTANDMVANSATAGSVTPLQFTIAPANDAITKIIGGTIKKSGTGTNTGATFYLHLFSAGPTVSTGSGDNAPFKTTDKDIYLGVLVGTTDRLFDDGYWGELVPLARGVIPVKPASGTRIVYGLLEVRGALVPASAETFAVSIEAE